MAIGACPLDGEPPTPVPVVVAAPPFAGWPPSVIPPTGLGEPVAPLEGEVAPLPCRLEPGCGALPFAPAPAPPGLPGVAEPGWGLAPGWEPEPGWPVTPG